MRRRRQATPSVPSPSGSVALRRLSREKSQSMAAAVAIGRTWRTSERSKSVRPATAAEAARVAMALEMVGDLRRLDHQLKDMKKRIADAVAASKTSLTELFGVGPIVACLLIGYSGDVTRFANRDRYAAYNGTAPVEVSSGGRITHRLSRRGNRTLNYAIHMAALSQLRYPHSQGRAFFDRKVAEGKTNREALRALKRRLSDAVYRQLLADAERQQA